MKNCPPKVQILARLYWQPLYLCNMKYSKYFKDEIKEHGLPHLGYKQWAIMMNIGGVEYAIQRLEKVKEMNQNSEEPYKYNLMIEKEEKILSHLTKNLTPEGILEMLVEESKKD